MLEVASSPAHAIVEGGRTSTWQRLSFLFRAKGELLGEVVSRLPQSVLAMILSELENGKHESLEIWDRHIHLQLEIICDLFAAETCSAD